ncbi:PspC domain-containing protein [Candidatus Clostridium stratigraminis]|uniref:PspC domain-containing protein n=1 Tax=Candidatus Clostridium stratigraminis TaxID=3381661 RepID=A0ABW8SZJ9_9CLOT
MDKRLYKSNSNKVIAGVCGGLAEYFDIDPTIVRLGFVLFVLLGGSGILGYLICALVIPSKIE